jgi:hypothetical protein
MTNLWLLISGGISYNIDGLVLKKGAKPENLEKTLDPRSKGEIPTYVSQIFLRN